MRNELKNSISSYYSRKHNSFEVQAFEDCLPAYKIEQTRFRFGAGFLYGCIATGTAFAAIVVSPYIREFVTKVEPFPSVDVVAAQNESIDQSGSENNSLGGRPGEPEILDYLSGASPDPQSEIANDGNSSFSTSRGTSSGASDSVPLELSERTVRILEEVQSRQLAGQWEEALNELNALYAEYDQLNSFEQATMLNFYTNTLIRFQMWEEAITAFALMTTIPNIRSDINARALLSLGQLNERVGDIRNSAAYYERWLDSIDGLEISEERISDVEVKLEKLNLILGN